MVKNERVVMVINNIRKLKIVESLVCLLKELYYESIKRDALKTLSSAKNYNNSKIRVVFICQYIPAWNKLEKTYQKMKEDTEFEPYILCVPSQIYRGKYTGEAGCNDVYDYIISRGYDTAINAMEGQDEWVSLKDINPDYVFYMRPYNTVLPHIYRTNRVAKYSKLCLVQYSSNITTDMISITLNRSFLAYVSLFFPATKEIAEMNKRRHKQGHAKELQKSINVGLLAAESIIDCKDSKSPEWDFSSINHFRLIWTPRWSTHPINGGTNFFVYKEFFYNLAKDNPNIDILIRPHPMMWDNFISKGEMSLEEKKEYISRCEALPNIRFDSSKDYNTSIWYSHVLVSDMSGIIPEYMVTEKPVIYCKSKNTDFDLTQHGQEVIDNCYLVSNEEELKHKIMEISEGKDELIAERKKFVREELIRKQMSNSNYIISLIKADYKNELI